MAVTKRLIDTLAVACALCAPLPSLALGLGSPQGTMVMGRPLEVRIPVLGDDAAGLRAQCVKLLPSLADGVESDHLPPASVGITGSELRPMITLRTTRPIHSPILQFRIRIECNHGFERDYFLLPEPYVAPAAPADPVLAVTPVPARQLPVPSAIQDGESMVVGEATTLRLMARKKYPNNSKRRVAFIRRMAAANPEVFPSRRDAADQILAEGQALNLPPKPVVPIAPVAPPSPRPAPQPKAAPPAEAPTPVPAAPKAAETPPPAPKPAPAPVPAKPSTDRLVISPGGAPAGKGGEKISMAEATQAMDRMTDLMNEQLKVQMEMTRQVGELQTQIEQLRKTLTTVQTEKQVIEQKLQQKEAESSSMLQLIIAIAAGGIGGAGVLTLLTRRRRT